MDARRASSDCANLLVVRPFDSVYLGIVITPWSKVMVLRRSSVYPHRWAPLIYASNDR
jgi:hypothetical protein